MPDSHNDLQIVRRYLDNVTTFINAIVENDSVAIVLACQVFEDHKKRQDAIPFENEEDRLLWLQMRGRTLAIGHFQHKRNEKIKMQAVGKAIHDCS
jgi:hypothetical protein